jgi:hypothetical protein
MILKNRIIRNLIAYIAENDITSAEYGIYKSPFGLKTPPPIDIWKYLMNAFDIDQHSEYLLRCIRTAVIEEDYLNAAVLKREIEINYFISETEIIDAGRNFLEQIINGCSVASSQRENYAVLTELLSKWNIQGIKSARTTADELKVIRNTIYNSDPEEMGLEAADIVMQMKYKHPLLVIWKYHSFFRILSKSPYV